MDNKEKTKQSVTVLMNNWLLIGSLTALLLGCSNRHNELESTRIDHFSCAQEAVQLIKTVNCIDKPIDNASDAVVLKSGSFVYLCHKHLGWVSLMYPYPGEAIDCNFRSINKQCSVGWGKDELVTHSFD